MASMWDRWCSEASPPLLLSPLSGLCMWTSLDWLNVGQAEWWGESQGSSQRGLSEVRVRKLSSLTGNLSLLCVGKDVGADRDEASFVRYWSFWSFDFPFLLIACLTFASYTSLLLSFFHIKVNYHGSHPKSNQCRGTIDETWYLSSPHDLSLSDTLWTNSVLFIFWQKSYDYLDWILFAML